MRLKLKRAKGLFVLGKILPEDIPQGLGLLRTEEDRLMVADGYLLGTVAGSEAKDKLEIPYTNAYLNAICIGFPIIRGLNKVHLRLLLSWTHGSNRLTAWDRQWGYWREEPDVGHREIGAEGGT